MEVSLKVGVMILMMMYVVTTNAKSSGFDLAKFMENVINEKIKENRKHKNMIASLKECNDLGSWCKDYSLYCSKHKVVRTYCKKTCKLCPKSNCKDTHPHCAEGVSRGYCTGRDNEIKWMQQNCKKSCGFCGNYLACKDKAKRCAQSKSYCGNLTYRKWMKTNCAKTCGFCDEHKCGVAKARTENKSGVIVGGKDAPKGYYPWQAAIYYDNLFICGGSLIDDKHVVTAAHCFRYLSTDASRYKITLGDNNRDYSEGTEQNIKAKIIKQHRKYRLADDTHDIAVIELKSSVEMTKYVSTACLPEENEKLKPGTNCYISGWGKTRYDGRSVTRLQHVKVPIASRSVCVKRNTFNYHKVNDKMICAGYNDGSNFASACHGDSGGPLVCQNSKGSWTLYGVVSWGSPLCNGLDRYTVFTRVSKYNQWLNKQTS